MRHIDQQPDGYILVALIVGLVDSDLLSVGQGTHGFCLKNG